MTQFNLNADFCSIAHVYPMIVIFKKIALIIIQMVRTFASLLFLLQVILHFAQGARLLLYEDIGHEGNSNKINVRLHDPTWML